MTATRTALCAALGLVLGHAAAAQEIKLYGDARLGLGYNIDNDGGLLVDDDGSTPDKVRAVSRVRFGVNMTGKTDSGITFGAEIRADNAEGGEGGTDGQNEGSVFVSGSFGTLSFGDVDGADYNWVGDVPGNYSLTGLGDYEETLFVSNGGDFGSDGGRSFADNPFALPTVRYDFDFGEFGFSLSSNRDLTDVGVGAGYSADFGGGSWRAGVGYYKFESFVALGEATPFVVEDVDGNPVVVEGDAADEVWPGGEQWSVGLGGEYESFALGATWVKIDSDTSDMGEFDADNLLLGASVTLDAWSFGLVYGTFLNAGGGLEDLDGDATYALSGQYDLGGGATVNGGVRRTYPIPTDDGGDSDSAWIGDFGITMNF